MFVDVGADKFDGLTSPYVKIAEEWASHDSVAAQTFFDRETLRKPRIGRFDGDHVFVIAHRDMHPILRSQRWPAAKFFKIPLDPHKLFSSSIESTFHK